MRQSVKKIVGNIFKFLLIIYLSILSLFCIRVIIMAFFCDSFIIPTSSMSPSLLPGNKVKVNKLLMGGRIYTKFDFENHARLSCFRMPGFSEVNPGDVICFNNPHGYDNNSKIEFMINNVFCKRVLGTPGDRIGAVDGHYWNDRVLRPIGVVQEQEKLRWMFDSVFIWRQCYDVIPLSRSGWNIKNWGPLTVPAKGLTLPLDDFTRQLYCQVIEYETGEPLDDTITEYTFQQDYYFAVGDNAMDSYDSRYWGFIPEDFIIGIVAGHRNHDQRVETELTQISRN